MGVNTNITLSPGTRVKDVAEVLGILIGLPHHMEPLRRTADDSFYLRVPGATVENVDLVPEMVNIILKGDAIDGEDLHSCFYHFEWSDGEPGSTGMMPRSTPFWIAAGLRLVQFFGGSIDFDDCDFTDIDVGPVPPSILPASDGQPWQDYENAKAAVVPLTKAELEAAREHANY